MHIWRSISHQRSYKLCAPIGFIFHVTPETPLTDALHNLFHHSILHSVTELMHSFVLVVPLLLLSWVFLKTLTPFFVGMLSHVIVDLLTHQTAGYNHFYPLPMAPLIAPVSYTSLWFTVVEHGLVIVFCFWVWRMWKTRTLEASTS